MSSEKEPCRCPVRPYGPSMASGSAWETNRLHEWDAKHAHHDYAKARDELAKALQYAEGSVSRAEQNKAGEAVMDMVHDVMGLLRRGTTVISLAEYAKEADAASSGVASPEDA